ncbi:MAG: hypothetical protein PHO20_02820 [Candidatus Peribacteraceae bacterium]|nr:hypothetical protein [Candidatus Peribacteraceae bacterium]MDD5739674.1 hypothetical protein [Candidatus Peribacteraceae bacterium]
MPEQSVTSDVDDSDNGESTAVVERLEEIVPLVSLAFPCLENVIQMDVIRKIINGQDLRPIWLTHCKPYVKTTDLILK